MVIDFAVILRNCHRRVDIFMLEFRKCASRGSEPTRDFGDLFTGFRQLRVKGVRNELMCVRTMLTKVKNILPRFLSESLRHSFSRILHIYRDRLRSSYAKHSHLVYDITTWPRFPKDSI